MTKTKIVSVTPENIGTYGFYCLRNPLKSGFAAKKNWLEQRFAEGLRIMMAWSEEGQQGFIEYVPGERSWRGVAAPGYFLIHCLYVSRKKDREQGLGARLLESCLQDARESGRKGVAMVTRDGPWLASNELLLKQGFVVADTAPQGYQLMVHSLQEDTLPTFGADWEARIGPYQGLHLMYGNQCPYHKHSVEAILEIAREHELVVHVTEWKSAEEAQQAPSPFGVFNLVYNGKLLADHYISGTRFRNILRKEILPKMT